MHAVYRLVDPRNRETFYVGIAKNVYARFFRHLRCDGSNPDKDARIQELKAANMMVVMETLQIAENIEIATKREAYWIRHFHNLGEPLTNQMIPRYKDDVPRTKRIEVPKITRKLEIINVALQQNTLRAEDLPKDGSLTLGKTLDGKRVQITKEQFETAIQLRKSGKSTGYRDLMKFFDLSEHHAKALNAHLRREVNA